VVVAENRQFGCLLFVVELTTNNVHVNINRHDAFLNVLNRDRQQFRPFRFDNDNDGHNNNTITQ
jgi:hypothetical protein